MLDKRFCIIIKITGCLSVYVFVPKDVGHVIIRNLWILYPLNFICLTRIYGGIKLYGHEGTKTASNSETRSRLPSSERRGRSSFLVPEMLTCFPPIPLMDDDEILMLVRSWASLTTILLAPVSIIWNTIGISYKTNVLLSKKWLRRCLRNRLCSYRC